MKIIFSYWADIHGLLPPFYKYCKQRPGRQQAWFHLKECVVIFIKFL